MSVQQKVDRLTKISLIWIESKHGNRELSAKIKQCFAEYMYLPKITLHDKVFIYKYNYSYYLAWILNVAEYRYGIRSVGLLHCYTYIATYLISGHHPSSQRLGHLILSPPPCETYSVRSNGASLCLRR